MLLDRSSVKSRRAMTQTACCEVLVDLVPIASEHDDEIKLLVGSIIFVVSALVGMLTLMTKTLANARTAATKATGTYDAVNGVGQGEHRLYDKVGHIAADVEMLVETNQKFQAKGFAGMSQDLATGPALEHTIREIQNVTGTVEERRQQLDERLAEIQTSGNRLAARLDEIQTVLNDHVERERQRDGVDE